MKTTKIPQRAPQLLFNLVNEDFGYVVNCQYPNSFRILNRGQFEILQSINNIDDLGMLAKQHDIEPELLTAFFLRLSEKEIIRFDDNFSSVQKPSRPQSLDFWIHTTNACNLGCSYCYISTLNTGGGMSSEVRTQLLSKLVEAVNTKGIKHVKLRLAGGEPMGQFKAWQAFIPEAIEILANVGCILEVAFITNLTLMNDDIIKFSKQHDIAYGVSLDGVGEYHDETRKFRSGMGSFDIVDKNIRLLLSNGIAVSINTVITNQNLFGLQELTHYLIALDVPFRYSIVQGEYIDGALLEQYLSSSHNIMEGAINTGWSLTKKYQFCDLKPNELDFQTCTSGFSGGAIYTDGSLKYCHVHFGDDSKQSLSIFNEQMDLLEMITESGQHQENRSEDCKKCRFRSVCTSGCPVYRVDGKDPQCSLYHRFIPKYYELQAKERLNLLYKHEII